MQNLKKLSRNDLKAVQGGDRPIINIRCINFYYCERTNSCVLSAEQCPSSPIVITPWKP
jgi:hypothetical protein